MGRIVYADLLFLINFSMDLLCLFASSKILHRKLGLLRGIIAAAFGGTYSVAILFLPMSSIVSVLLDLLFCAFMCCIAFGVSDGGWYKYFLTTSVFFGVSVGTGGLMTALFSFLNRLELPLEEVEKNGDGISVWLFAILAMISGVAATMGGKFFKAVSKDTVFVVDIVYRGKGISVKGMVDTGNLLRDPISGKPIIIVDTEELRGMMTSKCALDASDGKITEVISDDPTHKVRLVPINTAGGESMICAFVPDSIVMRAEGKGVTEKADALFAPSRLSPGVEKKAIGCGALLPSSII